MDYNIEKRIRISLAVFSSALSVALGFFVWIMLDASSNAMSSVLLGILVLVVAVTIVTQVIYSLKGQIFEFDGSLAKQEILFAIICFQVIMQFSFGFSIYAVKQTELQNSSVDSAYEYFITLQQAAGGNRAEDYQKLDLESNMPECVDAVFLVGSEDTSDANRYFRFPISGGRLLMRKSQYYFTRHLQDFLLSLLMSLVISILLMVELVYLAVKQIGSHDRRSDICPSEYLRQVAFLFYFGGYLCTSFVPIMARNLSSGGPNADFIAGLPYSVEAFTNCIAILLSTRFFRRNGWKPPYMIGVGIFIAGLVLSALSNNVFAFIASRAVVGTGYGFCWMTLRNVATLSGDRSERFASLTSGLYAGIMCGVAFGAVLADLIGYRYVLLVSAGMTLLSTVIPLMLRNDAGAFNKAEDRKIQLCARDIGVFVIFLVLIVIPTCISDSFRGFFVPLFVNRLDLPTAYVGRVSLVYNLCLVYISSTLLIRLVKMLTKNALFQNALHMIFISAALIIAGYFGGFGAIVVAAMLLGSVDGFGFSVQNSYILDTQIGRKIGTMGMLTYFSLFKKFGAMLAPMVFGLFIMNGFHGIVTMGITFIVCLAAGLVLILLLQKKEAVL